MATDPTRTSALLIRAWAEQDSGQRLTVRMMYERAGAAGQRDIYVASVEDVVRHVREWLSDVLDGPPVTKE